MKKSLAAKPFLYLSSFKTPPAYSHLAPALVRYVQGGCAIIMSHLPSTQCKTPSFVLNLKPYQSSPGIACLDGLSTFKTSPCMCHSGCPPEHSKISQEYASCPFSRKALHTAWLSSQATKTFILCTSLINHYVCCLELHSRPAVTSSQSR